MYAKNSMNCNCKTVQNVIGESDKICKQKSIHPFSITASASTAGAGVRPSRLGVKVGLHLEESPVYHSDT